MAAKCNIYLFLTNFSCFWNSFKMQCLFFSSFSQIRIMWFIESHKKSTKQICLYMDRRTLHHLQNCMTCTVLQIVHFWLGSVIFAGKRNVTSVNVSFLSRRPKYRRIAASREPCYIIQTHTDTFPCEQRSIRTGLMSWRYIAWAGNPAF